MELPKPKIVEHNGIFVGRDDLLPGGTKRRVIQPLLAETDYTEYVYPGTARGAAIVALGYAAAETGKKVTVVIAERETPNDVMQEALDAGCGLLEFRYVKMGFYPKIKKECERYTNLCLEKYYIKSGGDSEFSINKLSLVGQELLSKYGQFDYFISACSSGTLTRGFQDSRIAKHYIAVATGQKGIQPGIAEVIHHNNIQRFEQNPPKEDRPPFPSVLNYDGKCWKYAKELLDSNPTARILLWNVWATKDQRDKFHTTEEYVSNGGSF